MHFGKPAGDLDHVRYQLKDRPTAVFQNRRRPGI
jgi:hypothetical protein